MGSYGGYGSGWYQEPPRRPGVGQGRRRGVTQAPMRKRRKRNR